MELVAARLLITGRVQGVFFRQSTAERARAAGVVGSVRNRADGAVEAILQGPPSAVEALIAFCRAGPPAADVDAVEVDRIDVDPALATFSVR